MHLRTFCVAFVCVSLCVTAQATSVVPVTMRYYRPDMEVVLPERLTNIYSQKDVHRLLGLNLDLDMRAIEKKVHVVAGNKILLPPLDKNSFEEFEVLAAYFEELQGGSQFYIFPTMLDGQWVACALRLRVMPTQTKILDTFVIGSAEISTSAIKRHDSVIYRISHLASSMGIEIANGRIDFWRVCKEGGSSGPIVVQNILDLLGMPIPEPRAALHHFDVDQVRARHQMHLHENGIQFAPDFIMPIISTEPAVPVDHTPWVAPIVPPLAEVPKAASAPSAHEKREAARRRRLSKVAGALNKVMNAVFVAPQNKDFGRGTF
jgi:hypothetical protein